MSTGADTIAAAFGMTTEELSAALKDLFRTAAQELLAEHAQPRRRLFSTDETAVITNLPPSWIDRAARNGEMPSRKIGHYRKFADLDISALIEVCYSPAVTGDLVREFRAIDKRRAKETAS